MIIKTYLTLTLYYIGTLLLMPLLLLQAYLTRASIIKLPEALGGRSGCTSDDHSINLLIIGDSSAAGVGVNEQKDALSGQLSAKLSVKNGVSWQLVASTGFTSAELIKEIEALPVQKFDYVLVSVGVNDVTGLTSENNWVNNLNTIIDVLTAKFYASKVLITPLPPMHLFTGIPQPLRWWLGMRARRLNKLMVMVTAEKKQCTVLTVDFPFTPEYLAKDGFHPSKLAYGLWADRAAEVFIH